MVDMVQCVFSSVRARVLLADRTPSVRSGQSGGLREWHAYLASGLVQE